jgi:GntR family transcriptional repressor for pyruvate dehydrogenase complex
MEALFEPVEAKSLKDACAHQLERMIFSGKLDVGKRLPSERRLADALSVSRPILHQALVELEAKGLVTIIPRRGVFINDYRNEGSIAMLASFLSFHQGSLDNAFLSSVMGFRKLLEGETTRLAVSHGTQEDYNRLKEILRQETNSRREDSISLVELDFAFHLQIAYASGNLIYPLILNSFKGVYTSFADRFFRLSLGGSVIDQVHHFHERLIRDLESGDEAGAVSTMIEMLDHGERYLFEVIHGND